VVHLNFNRVSPNRVNLHGNYSFVCTKELVNKDDLVAFAQEKTELIKAVLNPSFNVWYEVKEISQEESKEMMNKIRKILGKSWLAYVKGNPQFYKGLIDIYLVGQGVRDGCYALVRNNAEKELLIEYATKLRLKTMQEVGGITVLPPSSMTRYIEEVKNDEKNEMHILGKYLGYYHCYSHDIMDVNSRKYIVKIQYNMGKYIGEYIFVCHVDKVTKEELETFAQEKVRQIQGVLDADFQVSYKIGEK
jgi:hypothetical protein